MSAKDTQVGGDHYSKMAIQPFEYVYANGLGFAEGAVVKYVSRWKAKGGLADLKKARHMLDLLIARVEEESLEDR
jgi:predicted transcriptional regulator